MTLVPVTTREDAINAYNENKSYDAGGGDIDKCEAFIDACRFLLQTPLRETSKDNESLGLDPRIVKEMLDEAVAWRRVTRGTLAASRNDIRYADLNNFRY